MGDAHPTAGRSSCPLCAPARARPFPPEYVPVSLDEAMLAHFGIAPTWLGWPVCPRHLGEYQTAAAKSKRGAAASARQQPQQSLKRARLDSSEPPAEDDAKTKEEGEEEEKKMASGTSQPRSHDGDAEGRGRQKKPKKPKKQRALDPVPLRPIGVFESCFPERHGTPRQGLLVPSSRGKLTLRRYCSWRLYLTSPPLVLHLHLLGRRFYNSTILRSPSTDH